MASPRLLIFDLDGTLIDSAPDIVRSVNELRTRHGLTAVAAPTVREAIGYGSRQLIAALMPDGADRDAIEAWTREYLDIYHAHPCQETRIYPDVVPFLEARNERMAIVTNKPGQLAHEILKTLGLDRFPWMKVYGGDTLKRQKPDPLPLLTAIETAGVSPEETVMIGDGVPDLEAARSARVRAIALSEGYTPRARLEELSPWKMVSGFKELSALWPFEQ